MLLLDALTALVDGKLVDPKDGRAKRKLMVFMPPGSAKSTYASILFPPWAMARNPKWSVLGASHSEDLAERFSFRIKIAYRSAPPAPWASRSIPNQTSDQSLEIGWRAVPRRVSGGWQWVSHRRIPRRYWPDRRPGEGQGSGPVRERPAETLGVVSVRLPAPAQAPRLPSADHDALARGRPRRAPAGERGRRVVRDLAADDRRGRRRSARASDRRTAVARVVHARHGARGAEGPGVVALAVPAAAHSRDRNVLEAGMAVPGPGDPSAEALRISRSTAAATMP